MHKQLATSLGRLHRAEGRPRDGPALRWYRALEAQVRELQRLLGKKAMENELLREVRVAFALDCCDREAMGHVATTGGVTAQDVQDLIVATVEHRFGPVNRLPEPVEWLTDNGSCYTARDTHAFARDIGLAPITTPVGSPQSNGMAEAFVRTLERDYVRVSPTPDAQTVIEQLPGWPAHYNDVHPHHALGYRSPREYIAQTREAPSGL